MPDVYETIEKITYTTDDTELKAAAKTIVDNSNAIVDLGQKRLALQAKYEAADKKDIDNKKKLATELEKLDKQIREHAKAVNQEAISNQKLNEVLKNEIGIIGNLKRKIDAIKIAKGFAQTEADVKDLNKQLIQTQAELNRIDNINVGINKKSGGGGIFSSILGGVGVGTGIELFRQGFQLLKTGISDSIAEAEDADKTLLDIQRTLKTFGGEKYLDGLISDADKWAEKLHNLFDNDDIVKAEQRLIQYGKISRDEINKLIPVIANLSAAEGIGLVDATEKVVNIMEGRGGQTLRDYGVSVKGVKTEHDRLNVVLGDFATKLEGAADTYATTSKGIEQTNSVLLANVEERFGKAFSNIKTKVLPIITDILEGLNYALESVDEARLRKIGVKGNAYVEKFKQLSEAQLKEEIAANKQRAISLSYVQDAIAKDELRRIEILNGKRDVAELDAIKKRLVANKKLLEQGTFDVTSRQNAINSINQANNPKGPINPNAQLAEGEAEKQVTKINKKISAASKKNPAKIDVELKAPTESDGALPNAPSINDQTKAAKERIAKIDAAAAEQSRKDQQAYYKSAFEDEMARRKENNAQQEVVEKENGKKLADAKYQAYLSGAGDVLSKVFEIEADLLNERIDNITDKIIVAQRELDQAEKIADRGNAELYDKQKKRLIDLENEKQRAREKEQEAAKIQQALNQALAFTQALLVVTNAGATGDPYSIAARIAAAVAALGAAYSFTQIFKGAREGLDEAGEGKTGSDSLNLPTPSGEDYYGNYYHLANREAVIQNHDGTADRYRPTIKAIRRGLLPNWVNDIAMGKTLPFMDNNAIQQAVIIVKSEGDKEVKALREDVNLLVRMIGNITLNSTNIDPYGNIVLQSRILAKQKRRDEL